MSGVEKLIKSNNFERRCLDSVPEDVDMNGRKKIWLEKITLTGKAVMMS